MKTNVKQLAAKGRGGDTQLAHVTPGEVVIPNEVKPIVGGLLAQAFAQHGLDPQQYTVGQQASRNPKTGLLEFKGGGGGDGDGGDASGGLGGGSSTGGMGGNQGGSTGYGSRGYGGGDNSTGDTSNADNSSANAQAVGNDMMAQNADPLGYGRYTGETVPGTLNNMANQMRDAQYRNGVISDTMRNMGVGFSQRAGVLGFGPALGTFGESVLNRIGALGATALAGPFGAPVGGLLGTAIVGQPSELGPQFAHNMVGLLGGQLGGQIGASLGGIQGAPLGGALGSMVAQRAMGQFSSAPDVASQAEPSAANNGDTTPSQWNVTPNLPAPATYTAQAQPNWVWHGSYFTQG